MSDELSVLCRQRPTLRRDDPPGLRWDPATGQGWYLGAELSLSDVDVKLPGGDEIVAVVRIHWSHRGLLVGGALSIEALAERLARDARGEVFDPRDDVRSKLVEAYLRDREAAYVRARDASEAARAHLADRPLPRSVAELRAAFARAILPDDDPEPRTTDPDLTALLDGLTRLDFSDRAGTYERQQLFEQFALTLAREGARIVRGHNDLQRIFAAYGLNAALRAPELRPELEAGGRLAQAIGAQWRAYDTRREKQRAWLRRSWPKIETELLKYSPKPEPAFQALRRKPKLWPDGLVDELLDACELSLSMRPPTRPAGSAFVERLGLSPDDAPEVMSYITRHWLR